MAGDTQPSGGFMKIMNDLAEALAATRLTQRQHQVVWAVLRKTLGYNKVTDRITADQLADLTKLTSQEASRALNDLINFGVVVREGGSRSPVGIQMDTSKWHLESKASATPKARVNENIKNRSLNDKIVNSVNDIVDNTKDNKDSIKVEANASTSSTDVDGDAPLNGHKRTPPCPHDAILTLWAKHFPDKPQPKTWTGTRQTNLAARWRQGFAEKVRRGKRQGETFYADRDTGIDWWDRFFGYCAKQRFLRDGNFFVLDWVVKPSNFAKVLDGNYEGGKHD